MLNCWSSSSSLFCDQRKEIYWSCLLFSPMFLVDCRSWRCFSNSFQCHTESEFSTQVEEDEVGLLDGGWWVVFTWKCESKSSHDVIPGAVKINLHIHCSLLLKATMTTVIILSRLESPFGGYEVWVGDQTSYKTFQRGRKTKEIGNSVNIQFPFQRQSFIF